VHQQRRIEDRGVFKDRDGELAVRAAAAWECSISERLSGRERHGCVEAESFVNDVVKILHVLDLCVRRNAVLVVGVKGFEYRGAKLGHNSWVAGELEDDPRQGRGSGIGAGEEDGGQIVTDDFSICGPACEGVQKGIVGIFS